MLTPYQIAFAIVKREGKWSDDPDDAGGKTNYGVTLRTLKDLGIDLDHDGDVDADDLRLMTADRAAEIFLQHYYKGPQIDDLARRFPNRGTRLRAAVFDMSVNSGRNAVKILQRFCVRCGEVVGVDGKIGHKTLSAVDVLARKDVDDLASGYSIARRNWYFRVADKRPSQRKYCRTRTGAKGGWIRRAEEFLRPDERMTDAEFAERIGRWDS